MTDLDLITDKPEPLTIIDWFSIGAMIGVFMAAATALLLWAMT